MAIRAVPILENTAGVVWKETAARAVIRTVALQSWRKMNSVLAEGNAAVMPLVMCVCRICFASSEYSYILYQYYI